MQRPDQSAHRAPTRSLDVGDAARRRSPIMQAYFCTSFGWGHTLRRCATAPAKSRRPPNVGWDKPVTIDKTCLRDGPLLVLAYGLSSLLVLDLFGTNAVMRFPWLLLGPAVFLIMRHGLWFIVFSVIGVVIGKVLQGSGLSEIVGNTARHALVLFLGAWTYRRTGGADLTFNGVPDYLRLYGVGLLMGLFTGGVNSIQSYFGLPGLVQDSSLHLASGVMFGVIITMLPLLATREWSNVFRTRRGSWEGVLIIGLSILVGQVVFLNWAHESLGQVARGYWMFLFVTLAALRLGPGGTMIVISIAAIQALAGALNGLGFFSDDLGKTHLTNYYFYVLSLSSDGALVAVLFMKGQRDQQALTDRSAELERFNAELRRTNADLEQFAYVASHDLREPLRMVSSYMALLERRYGDILDEEAHEFLAFAKEGAIRMDSLVQDLLDFSRIGRIADPPQVNRLGDLLARALQTLEIAIKEADAQVKVPSTLPSVCCRGGEIVRVFQNLIGNAVKFRVLERRPVIEISCQRQGETWQLSVSDNGIGIDPSYNDRVFMIFQRLHTRDKYEGTGIGLAVCKKIIEQHGGRIWVEGKPGQGSTFFFTLPANPVAT